MREHKAAGVSFAMDWGEDVPMLREVIMRQQREPLVEVTLPSHPHLTVNHGASRAWLSLTTLIAAIQRGDTEDMRK